MQKKSHSVQEALQKLQRYCMYQERCHAEVRKKLTDMRMIPDAIDHIIVQLIKDDYLNEARFVAIFVRSKFHQKKWGRLRLKNELKQRDISRLLIDKALKEIDEEEYQQSFDALALKRNQQLNDKNKYVRRKKLADYLLYRGWESALVYEKVKALIP